MRYANDTVLLAETEQDLQDILDEANRTGKTFDVKMNAKHTKSMLVSKDVNLITVILKIDGDSIKQTDKDTYLDKNYNTKWKM